MIRKTTDARLRGRRLQSIRADHFRLHPLCVRCLSLTPPVITLATQLDHVVPLEHGGLDFDQDDGQNRQGLCDPCHDLKTRKDRGIKRPGGFDAKGDPIEY